MLKEFNINKSFTTQSTYPITHFVVFLQSDPLSSLVKYAGILQRTKQGD